MVVRHRYRRRLARNVDHGSWLASGDALTAHGRIKHIQRMGAPQHLLGEALGQYKRRPAVDGESEVQVLGLQLEDRGEYGNPFPRQQ